MAERIPHPTRRSRPRGSRALVFAVLVALCAASLPVPTFADVSLASVTVASPLAYAGDSFHYNRVVDACGVCGGVGESCQGCDRVSNSPFVYDACGRCQDPAGQDAFTFNATCNDCTGDVHGPKIVDDCGVCRDPADPLFSRAGIPDYHLGGCVGCDGVPNSGNVLDACGVCAGLGCAPSDETKRSWCCDCAGVPFGPHIINFCCECVDRFAHWGALSGAKGPPENHSRAEFLWAKGRSILADADAAAAHLRSDIANRTAAGLGATFNRSETVYATYVDAIAHFDAGWEAISHPSSDDLSECYSDVYLTGNASNPRDICGVCGGDNSTCLGCVPNAPNQLGSPIPDGGLFSDDCGVCGGEQGFVDDCGVCFGGNETCVGCDGVPNSGKVMDGCDGSQDFRFLSFMGRLGEVGSGCSDPDEFRAACDAGEGGCCGCDGTPNSGHTLDGCGACFDQGDENNTHLVNATCNGCDGVAHSGVVFDYCCSCGGDAGYDDACYHDLLYEGEFSETPFDPYTSSHALYFTEEGKRTIDECGECRGWGYNGSTCLGCDGVYGSGLVRDGCGVCGGDCSTCTAAETGLPHDCEPPGRGWTGMDRTCTFVRTSGPDGPDDAWVRWGAFPNGTDRNGQKLPANESWYRRVNRPGALPFEEDHIGECRMYLEPEPPPSPRERREWVVKVFGKEEGPYTLDELESGSIIVTDSTTGEEISSPLLPTTLVARMTTYYQQQTINYGITSQYESRVALWQERSADRIVSSPSAARVPNEVVVEGNATELWHDGEFMPMAIMPGMERIIYPYCTGSTWRGGEHRLHGKKLPGNYLGIITSKNITDTTGLADQAWNPLDEYIFDVSTGWIDQRCTCSSEWQYQSEPIAPTCPRVWFPWSGWVDDGWFVSHNTYFDDPERYTLEPRRSWAGGGWRVSGGWWVQDYGGGGSSQYGSATSNIYNAYGDEGDYGFGAMRGPVRVDAAGVLSVTTVAPTGEDRTQGSGAVVDGVLHPGLDLDRCYAAARVSPARRNSSGAVWSVAREDVNGTWESEFVFFVHEQAETCVDVHAVSRSFTEEVRTRTHRTCRSAGGDGFAFVLRDDTDDAPGRESVGAPGPGLGYQGLRRSLAVEFDTWHNPLNDEPYERHVAVHTNGAEPNDAHHGARLGSTVDVPDFADGEKHRVRVSFSPAAGWEAIAAAIESGDCKGSTARLAHFTRENPGLLRVFVDDMDVPALTVPLSMETVLRPGGSTAWVGFTGGTGESWQAVDLVSWNFTSYG